MFGFLLLRGDKLHPEAFMEEKNEAMMVREPWLEINFKPVRRCLALPYYLYCLRLRRLVLI